jgi:probable HAF family extracellular repeat protein
MLLKNFYRLILVIALSAASLSAHANYTFSLLDTPGFAGSAAFAINNSGQVVGFTIGPQFQATIWSGTTTTYLGSFNAFSINDSGQVVGTSNYQGYTYSNQATIWNGTTTIILGNGNAAGINDSGQVVGQSGERATLWSNGNATDLGTLGGYSYATAINDSGQIVGASNTTSGQHATLWSNGTITDLGTLGGVSSYAVSINNSGQIVGYSNFSGANGYHATLWSNGVAIDLGTLGGNNSSATAINALGQIVGSSSVADAQTDRATLWNGITAVDLNSFLSADALSAGWELNSANDINDNGWIVGQASNNLLGIYNQAFLLTPVAVVPEADTSAMLLMGLGLFGFIVRNRKAI